MRRVAIAAALLLLQACAGAGQPRQAATAAPALKLDHVWIATETGAPRERAALEQAGFTVAPTVNRHDGQGTASITVEFENGFLELIYPDESVPAVGSAAIARTRFAERAAWRSSGHSPFGVALARTPATPARFPFETWRVTSEWMGEGNYMEMLTPRGSRAVNFAVHAHATDEAANLRTIAGGGEAAAAFRHANGARRVGSLRITAPSAEGLPPSADFVRGTGALELRIGSEWLMELTLDRGDRRTVDLRPDLPLIVRY